MPSNISRWHYSIMKKLPTRLSRLRRAPVQELSNIAHDTSDRVIIEGVTPEIDGGRFAIKRTRGESVLVEADIFADGHDAISAGFCLFPPPDQKRGGKAT